MHCHRHSRSTGTFPPSAWLGFALLASALAGCAPGQENRYVPAGTVVCDDRDVTLQTRKYEYDEKWRLTKETVTDGQDAALSVTTWRYAADDHAVKTEQRPGWSSQSDVYFTQGNIKREESAVSDGGKNYTVRLEYEYNSRGDPASFTRTAVDDRGRLLERYSEIYEYEYTEWGRPAVKTVKMGESPSIASSSRTTYAYDVNFLLVSERTATEEGLPGEKQYFYDEHKRVAATLGAHPYKNEYFRYFDKVQGTPAAPAPPSFPLTGTVNDSDILLLAAAAPGSESVGTLRRGERVSVLEVSDRIDAREGLRAPWLRLRTAAGREGWAFGFFIDTDLFFSVLAYGGAMLDPDPPPPLRSYVYFNKQRTRLYGDLTGFTVGETGTAGDQAQFLRQDNHLYQSGNRYHRFLLVTYQGRDWWVSGNDITLHYLPYRKGYFTAEENPVFREVGGAYSLCLERSLFYTAENGIRHFLLPLTVFRGDDSVRFTLSGLSVRDANGDGLEDIILKGEEGRSRVNASGGEKTVVERWARLRHNALEIMFDKKDRGGSGLTLFHYEYEYTRDADGFITGIVETRRYDDSSLPDQVNLYIWNGHAYEKLE